ncbi:MAG: P-loop NTPase [Clostridiaceae bacterium]|nr:P-loop NTPase [Clostridiaceae bacterium]
MSQNESKNSIPEMIDDFKIKIYLSDFLKGIKKFWWLCVALAVIAGGFKLTVGYFNFVPVYTTSATFTVSTQSSSQTIGGVSVYSFFYDSSTASQIAKTFPYIMSSNILQDAICEDLGISAMPASLSASCVSDSNMITITARGVDPKKTYDVLVSAIKNLPEAAKFVVGNIRLTAISDPFIPANPSNSSAYVKEAIKWAIIGFGIGAAWIIFYVFLRSTVKTKKDIKTQLNMESVGTVPQVSFKKQTKQINQSVLLTNPKIGSGFLESVRVMRNTFVNSLKPNEKVIMVTSTAPGEGKTTVITNLALSLADCGKNVLLVDADIHNPSVAPLLGIDPEQTEYYEKSEDYAITRLDEFKISFMAFKSIEEAHGKGRMNAERIKDIFDSVRDKYDYILIDTPPCGLISDSMFIAQASDAALYVILQDTVRVTKIRSGLDNIMSANVRVIGCVLNGALSGITGYGYNYGYGYGGYRSYGKYSGYGYGYGYGRKHRQKKEND